MKTGKKLTINDIDFVIEQLNDVSGKNGIKNHKLVNNLKILLEKNVVINNTGDDEDRNNFYREKQELVDLVDKLALLRRNTVREYSKEYNEAVEEVLGKIEKNHNDIKNRGEEFTSVEFKMSDEIIGDNLLSRVAPIYSKLIKVKEMLEGGNGEREWRGDGRDYIVEEYFRRL